MHNSMLADIGHMIHSQVVAEKAPGTIRRSGFYHALVGLAIIADRAPDALLRFSGRGFQWPRREHRDRRGCPVPPAYG